MQKCSRSEMVSIYLQGMDGCYRKITWQMEEDMHSYFDAMVDVRNVPLKQLTWEWDWSTANEENRPVDLHLTSRERQHHLDRECLEAARAICLLLWGEEGTVYLGT